MESSLSSSLTTSSTNTRSSRTHQECTINQPSSPSNRHHSTGHEAMSLEQHNTLTIEDLQNKYAPDTSDCIRNYTCENPSQISDLVPLVTHLNNELLTALTGGDQSITSSSDNNPCLNKSPLSGRTNPEALFSVSEDPESNVTGRASPEKMVSPNVTGDRIHYGRPGNNMRSGMNLSFSGCGFLGIYHVGAAACLRKYAPELPIDFIAGASAGAMAAACLLSNANLGLIRSSIIRSASQSRCRLLGPFSPSFDIQQELRNGLTQVLPANAHEIVSGRLFISVTRISDGKNILLSQFDTRDELVQALLCSSFIPMFSGLRPMSFRGVRYVDGGFSDNLPVHDSATVTVSPFSGEADICPTDHTAAGLLSFSVTNTNFQLSRRNMQRFVHALFPPSPEALQKVCQQGFDDTLDFLQRNKLVSCTRCSAVLSSVSLSPVTSREESVDGSDSGEWEEDGARCTIAGNTSDELPDDTTCQDGDCPIETAKKVYFSLPGDSEDCESFEQSCVNCPHCRKHMQEAVMNDINQVIYEGPGAPLVPRSPRSKTLRVVSYIVMPITYSVKVPFRIVAQMVSVLPLPALLRLHEFTVEVAELARRALLTRRQAAASEPLPTQDWTTFQDNAAIDESTRADDVTTKEGWSAPDFRCFENETLIRLAQQFARRSSRLSRPTSSDAVSCPPSGPCVFVCLSRPESASAPLLCDTRDLKLRL